MSYSVKLEKIAKQRKEARDIASQILKYGITEQQKYDIIFELAISLENNSALKDVTSILKKYRETINNDLEAVDNKEDTKPKIIIS